MKNKYILSVQQRAAIDREVMTHFKKLEQKCRDNATGQYAFLYLLSTAMVLTDECGFDETQRFDTINAIKEKFLELSDFLVSNTCTIGNSKHEVYDVDANLSYIERFCKQYGMEYNEEVFEEVNYDK